MKKNILLIHGWDYELYTKMTQETDPWYYAKDLVEELEKTYNVKKVVLPGFCHQKEPKDKEWNIEDYASYIDDYIKKCNMNIDIIIGYSFGGAVALKWKDKHKNDTKLFLIAPAIIRNQDNSKKFAKTPKAIQGIRNFLRDLYVIYIVKNNEMKYGTNFLRKSYQSIVREDLREQLKSINPNDITMVYGSEDDAVDPKEMINSVDEMFKDRIETIDNADHDNIITDYNKELIRALNRSLK